MYEEIKTTREFLRDLFDVVNFDYKNYWMRAIEIYFKDMDPNCLVLLLIFLFI